MLLCPFHLEILELMDFKIHEVVCQSNTFKCKTWGCLLIMIGVMMEHLLEEIKFLNYFWGIWLNGVSLMGV